MHSDDLTIRFKAFYDYLIEREIVTSASNFAKRIGISPSLMTEIEKGRSNVGVKVIQNTVNAFSEIDSDWLLIGRGSMLRSQLLQLEQVGIPLIPIEAFAGYANGDVSVNSYEVQRYFIPEFYKKADVLVRLNGDSMEDRYLSGDVLGCKYIPTTFIQWGKPYVMDTVQGPICKLLFESPKKDVVICRSKNKNYPDFELPWKEVRALAIVVGVVRLE